MTIRKVMVLVCVALMLPLSALAQPDKGGGQTYVIKKGDTLWGISQRFLKDPGYWPDLWANNPFIGNPHFIYPGQRVAIYDGRLVVIPVEPAPAAQKAAPAAAPPPPKPVKAITVTTGGFGHGFLSVDRLKGASTLVDTIDNRILMAAGDKIFVDLAKPAKTGDRFDIFSTGDKIKDPRTGNNLGYQITRLGTATLTAVDGNVGTAVINSANSEIERGARLLPHQKQPNAVTLKKASAALSGEIVASGGNKLVLSQFDIIYVDLGAADGLQAGNILYLSRPRKATEFAKKLGHPFHLPDILLGSAVVVATQPHTATALILKV
ncbi:MAG TPA: LysM domain-containing protein, partial [Desulfuromonadales bacterium]|nr:LysM domain-containing protein [Desulfuromonadales bacterium]